MLSALDIARRLDAGTLSIDALYDEIAATIASREPEIRAFVSVDVEAARAAARSAYGPLAGMPMGVKDNIETGEGVRLIGAGADAAAADSAAYGTSPGDSPEGLRSRA